MLWKGWDQKGQQARVMITEHLPGMISIHSHAHGDHQQSFLLQGLSVYWKKKEMKLSWLLPYPLQTWPR